MIIDTIHTEYLTPSRTIETIKIGIEDLEKLVYVYNYEGYSFRLFTSEEALEVFLSIGAESELHFSSEEELDDFLLSQAAKLTAVI